MLVQSAKAKGRHLQKLVCKVLERAGAEFGLVAGDLSSRSMGANGCDIILSPAAIRVYSDLQIECKNCETLNVVHTYFSHAKKTLERPSAREDTFPILIHKRNHSDPLCTVSLPHLVALLVNNAELRHLLANNTELRQLKDASARRKD